MLKRDCIDNIEKCGQIYNKNVIGVFWESNVSGKGQQWKVLVEDGNEDWRYFIFMLEDF